MQRNSLLALLLANKGKGRFAAEAADGKTVVYLYDTIVASESDAAWFGGVSPEAFARTLDAAAGALEIRVNSPGGDVFGGRAMAAAIERYAGTVTVQVDGIAASAASFLIQAADRIHMAEGAQIMIHKAWSWGVGNADDLHKQADVLTRIDAEMIATYAKAAARRGVEAPDFAALVAAETWLTADEAIAAGLADRPDADGADAALQWDLRAFATPPADPPTAPPAASNFTHRQRQARALLLKTA